MLNNASKFAIGAGVLAFVLAVTPLHDDHAASLILLGAALAAAAIAFGAARSLGADLAPFVAADATPSSTPIDPADSPRSSVSPLVLAVGATLAFAGGAAGPRYVLAGVIVSVLGAGLWAFDSLRAPGVLDEATAENVNHRFLGPIGLPAAAFLTAIGIAYSFSRVLLATSQTASWVTALIVAAVLLAILTGLAERPQATKVVSGLAAVGVVITLAAGGTGAAIGEREFHPHAHTTPIVDITAHQIAFDRKVIALPADTEVEMVFTNLDVGTFHNVAIYTEGEPGTPIYNGRPSAKGVEKYEFETPKAGTYRYVCDFHPAMTGELRLTEGGEASAESHEESSEPAEEMKESEH